jgi:DNA-binding GntR family transcriptional regulator
MTGMERTVEGHVTSVGQVEQLPLLRPSLADMAYDRLEADVVRCALRPGAEVTLQELQGLAALGRTPVREAVKRLAADTLMVVRPRAGIQIAPIDLDREAKLLPLRRHLERFVVARAAAIAGPAQRSHMMRLARKLRDGRDSLKVDGFNALDRQIDRVILTAAGEPFLEHSLRPLRTLSRRGGWLCVTYLPSVSRLSEAIDCHIAVLDAVVRREVGAAEGAADRLVDVAERMLEALEQGVDPALLDARLDVDVPSAMTPE